MDAIAVAQATTTTTNQNQLSTSSSSSSGGGGGNGSGVGNDLTTKLIVFEADDKKFCYETNQHPNVMVVGSTSGKHDHGSSKVKLKSIVDYKWDLRHYPGRLITVHIDGKHIAYAILMRSNEGMVRVVNPSNGHRALIKGMTTEVLDLQFAHIKNLMVLACIEENALHLHKIDSTADKIVCTALLTIEDPSVAATPGPTAAQHRLNWCPYVPEKETEIDEYVSQQLVWVRGTQFRCYSVRAVVNMYGIGTRLSAEAVEGTLSNRETAGITGASFSPDGTTLCVSCEDGMVRFYQVYFHTNEPNPRRLHHWVPHGGKAVSSFFFLDNLTKYSKDKSLWRHCITASDDNTEIKVWCCSKWECLQTVHFSSPHPGGQLQLNAQIDRTSSYLVLTDSKHRGLYVLQVQIDASGSPPRNHADALLSRRLRGDAAAAGAAGTEQADALNSLSNAAGSSAAAVSEGPRSVAYIKSIAEFPLSSSILSYHIVDAAVRRYKCAFNEYLLEELDDYDEENNSLYCVVINMYLVQPKSMQECHVLYQPTVDEDASVLSSLENVNDEAAAAVATSASSLEGVVALNGSANSSGNAAEISSQLITPLTSKVKAPSVDVATSAGAVAEQTTAPTSITLEELMATAPPQTLQGLEAKQLQAAAAVVSQTLPTRSPGNTINLMTPDSFQSPRERQTPEGVSSDVRSALQMLAAQTQSPFDAARKPIATTADAANRLNMTASSAASAANETAETTALADEVAANVSGRQSVEINNQILAPECGAALLATAAAAASGGSSPSREVQEILSPKNSDIINDFFDDSTDLSDDNDVDSVTGKKNLGDQYNFNKPNSKEPHDTKASLSNKTGSGAWPKVPVVPPGLSNMHCANFNNINAPPAGVNSATGGADVVDAAAFNDMGNKLDQLLEFVQAQTCQIAELRNVAAVERKRADEAHAQNAQLLEKRLAKVYEEHMQRTKRDHAQRLDEYKKAHVAQNVEFRNQIVQALTQVVSAQVTERITGLLLAELQQRIVPVIVSRLDQIKHQIQTDVAHKLSVCDQLLRDNIAKVCTNKGTMEVFGNAVLLGVQASLQNTYGETMVGTLVPAYEKATGDMFKQVQEVFDNGTKSYCKLFENYFAQYEPVQENLSALVASLPEQLRVSSETVLTAYSGKMTGDLQRDLKVMQAQLIQTVRDNVKNEIKKGFEAQTATIEDSVRSVVRSQSQTPAPSIYDVQEQIRSMLAQGQVNTAFHQALVANDLALVEFTIEKADYTAVFNPCPLQQTVLLSLIQQISADMSNHNELKQRYLAEAILNLNMRDATTKEHAPKVLRELSEHCQAYTVANPGSQYNSGIRMLMMAVQGLGIKLF